MFYALLTSRFEYDHAHDRQDIFCNGTSRFREASFPFLTNQQQSHIHICLGHSLFVSQFIALLTKCHMWQLFYGLLFWIHFILEEIFLFFQQLEVEWKSSCPNSMQERTRVVNLEMHLTLLFGKSRVVGSPLICKEALHALRLSSTTFYCATFGCSWLPDST